MPKFLGYSMTWHGKPKLKIASQSRQRLGGENPSRATARPRAGHAANQWRRLLLGNSLQIPQPSLEMFPHQPIHADE